MMFSCTDETQISSCSNAGYHITSLIFYLMASGMANNYMKVSCKRTGKLRNGPKHWIYEGCFKVHVSRLITPDGQKVQLRFGKMQN